MITFEIIQNHPTRKMRVKLGGKVVGEIRTNGPGFHYVPTGQKHGGDTYPTLKACKESLGND